MTAGDGTGRATDPASARQVDAWLAELGIAPAERAQREHVTSWDVVLDGRLRPGIQATLILEPALALLCWVQYAPPIDESFRVSYRILLRWNDELPFVKFAVSDDERPVLTMEIPVVALDRDTLGTALARLVAVCDLLFLDSARWLQPRGSRKGAWPPPPPAHPSPLLERFAERLGELASAGLPTADVTPDASGVDTLGRP